MKIGPVDLDREVLVVAEIGNNHEGNVDLAEKMIGLAAEAGAGAVKFQAIVPERLVSIEQTERIEQLRRFQLKEGDLKRLAERAHAEGIVFLCTPFDIETAQFLSPLVPAFKIASGDFTFYPLLETVADTGKPILLSVGGTTLEEVKRTREFIRARWKGRGIGGDLALLHCVVSYPTPTEEANLRAIETLKGLGDVVGYSDHTMGVEAAVLSVALGARIVEKHFTIRKDYSDFRDHRLSADPDELKQMVKRIRDAQLMLGDGERSVGKSERGNIEAVRRSIAASRELSAGTRIERTHLCWVRPAGGIAPGREPEILGRVLRRSIRAGEFIVHEDLL
ncbi:MAG: N-acetylneuraminate synthase family protein [Deltaproteobacteria bacterium]|nr:N-acetylneuraminate synthase family protein [Deltaproteobacteria bacterium]